MLVSEENNAPLRDCINELLLVTMRNTQGVITCDGEISNQLIAVRVFQQVEYLQAVELSTNDRRYIMVGPGVERARVGQRPCALSVGFSGSTLLSTAGHTPIGSTMNELGGRHCIQLLAAVNIARKSRCTVS